MTDFPTSLLMWANPDPKYPNSFIIKIANQRLLGLTRTDKNGTTYWKFKERGQLVQPDPASSPVRDPIQKFQLRQTQAEPITNSHEPASNSVENNNNSE